MISAQRTPPILSARLLVSVTGLVAAALGAVAISYAPANLQLVPVAAVVLAAAGIIASTRQGAALATLVIVGATFVTRFRVDIGGFGFRPEHAVLIVLLVGAATSGALPRVLRMAARPAFVWLGLFVAWSACASILLSPDVLKSLAIVFWLSMDWAIAVLVSAMFWPSRERLERVGLGWATLAFGVALILWAADHFAGFGFGTQFENITHQQALYGLSYEANLLGSTTAIWLFIGLTSDVGLRKWQMILIVGLGSACLLLSYTRAAALALVAGLAFTLLWGGDRKRFKMTGRLAATGCVVVCAIAATPSISQPVLEKLRDSTAINDANGGLRVRSVLVARDDFEGKPSALLTGFGTNSFGQRHEDPSLPGLHVPAYLSVFPVEVLYSTGLIGFVLLVCAFVSLVKRSRQRARAIGLSIVFIVSALTTSPFWLGSTWILIAIAAISAYRDDPAML